MHTDLITSPMMGLIPYSVLHTDTAWANTDDNCSKCCSNWITFTLAPVEQRAYTKENEFSNLSSVVYTEEVLQGQVLLSINDILYSIKFDHRFRMCLRYKPRR